MHEDGLTHTAPLGISSPAEAIGRGLRDPNDTGPGAEAIQAWLVSRLSALLAIDRSEIDVAEPFASYGLGSTELVGLSGDLSEWLGKDLPAELAYECPTIDAVARRLASSSSAPPSVPDIRRSSTDGEPIAIVGIGCRFPGASNARAFWKLLREGVDAISEVPAERFDLNAYFDPDPAAPGKMATRWGGFIEDVDQFDAHFFGISPREAARMDPQQRLLLEVVSEALEDAGLVRETLAGTSTGIFIGISNNDYGRNQLNDLDRIDAYAGTGNALSIAANRISYVFDFRGPSLAIDTACSSSLVAVHQACASLNNGESTLALAGGVNLILSPAITINFTKAGAMAPDGRCKAFDARANGYVRSEGAGVVVLKPLSRALADGDPIYAVIAGSAVNQDGRSNGLMAPNPLAQEAVLREAYRRASVSPGQVQYVEAHGTGTLLGDPIEANALGAVLALDRPAERPCWIGSVKTNIGHLEAAAGIAGLIKVALALQHRELPPSLHFHEPNSHIPFERLLLRVNTAPVQWPSAAGAGVAGVSSFGFGGTNAHVVVREAPGCGSPVRPAEEAHDPERSARATCLLPLSARTPAALQSLARRYRDLLAEPTESAAIADDVCYGASARRSHHEHRLAVTGESAAQLAHGLDDFLRGQIRPGLSSGRRLSDRGRKLVFVFPGQGNQWFGMGRRLLTQEAVFRQVIERCDEAMRPHGDWSLLTELAATDPTHSRLHEVGVLQPALFAIQVALTAVWRSWGIEPQAVVGHSMGEVAAAHVAGALNLEDAVRVICSRSRLVEPTIGRGAMAAVELSIADAERALVGYEDRVSVAVSNALTSTVLSGDSAALDTIVGRLQRREIFCRTLEVEFAAHSLQMEPLRAALERALEGLRPGPHAVPIYSTVTGQIAEDSSFDPRYWSRNLREPVLFSTAVQRLIEDGYDVFLEVSPHPVLLGSIQQSLRHAGKQGAVVPSLRRDEDDGSVLAGSLGALYTLGHPVDWKRIYPEGGSFVPLPSYPWQRERCWLDPPSGGSERARQAYPADAAAHPLLGKRFTSAHTDTHFWETSLPETHLDDHRVEGVALLAAARYVEIANAAAAEVFSPRPFVLADVSLRKALFLADGHAPDLQVILSVAADGTASVRIYSRRRVEDTSPRKWTLHATATIRPQEDHDISMDVEEHSPAAVQARCPERVSGEDYYLGLRARGVDYGASLRSISQLWGRDGEVLGEVNLSSAAGDAEGARCHPALLDACIQTFGAGVAAQAAGHGTQGIYMPTRMDEIRIYGEPGRHLWSHARLRASDADVATGDVRLLDEAGRIVVEILGLRFESLARTDHDDLDDWLYEFQWRPRDRADEQTAIRTAGPVRAGEWLIFADRGGVGVALAAAIDASGGKSVLIDHGHSYARCDDTHYCIRPGRPEDLRRVLEAVPLAAQSIVHLWSLDGPPAEDASEASLRVAQLLGCGSVLHALQELGRDEGPNPPRLWLITRGAQHAGEESFAVDAAQAPLWGLGRVIAQEHPLLWGGLVDLDPNASYAAAAHLLLNEISFPDGEDQVAFRQGRRFVGRLMRRSRSAPVSPFLGWRTDATYLITGGMGDLGLSVARWMVEQGARRVILMGRTPISPRAQWASADAASPLGRRLAAILELEALGASVHLASVDVADEQELSGFLREFRQEGWPPIRGVVHAAGVLQDGLLMQLDAAAFDTVLRPKILGAWLLDHLLASSPLDFFVLFSSAGSLLGQPGQGNYAAANAFLDALAHQRRARGQQALSINWGAWSDLGFANTAGGKRLASRLALQGVRPLAPSEALSVLGKLLGQSSSQVAAVPVDWSRYRQFYPAGSDPPLLSELADGRVATAPVGSAGGTRTMLLAAEPAEREQLLQSYVSQRVALVLGMSGTALDVQQPLSNLGLDSLMAVELKNRIAIDLGVNLPMVTLLSGPSVEQAVATLLELLMSDAPLSSEPNPTGLLLTPNEHAINMDESALAALSDEAVTSLLTELLAKQDAAQ